MADDCSGQEGFQVVAWAWERAALTESRWERFLVRQCVECRRLDVARTWYVTPNLLTCLACLSQDVEPRASRSVQESRYRCRSCGTENRLVFEPDELPVTPRLGDDV
jgi:hypothetical protein